MEIDEYFKNEQQEKVMLGVDDIRKILRCGRDRAYQIMNGNYFHIIELGRRKVVHKDTFYEWLRGKPIAQDL